MNIPFACAQDLYATGGHPRLFVGPADLPALRERAGRGEVRAWRDELLRRARAFTDAGSPARLDPAADPATLSSHPCIAKAVHALAFAHLLTGEPTWAERALPLLRALVGADTTYGDGMGDLPLAFDLLHDALPDADRDRLESVLRQRIDHFQRAVLGAPSNAYWGLGTNLFTGEFMYYLQALAAVCRTDADRAALAACPDLLRRSIHQGADRGGALYEGPSYGYNEGWAWTLGAEILARAGTADLWTGEPRLAAALRHWVYQLMPGRRGHHPRCDAWRFAGHYPPIFLLLGARRYADPALQWAWEQYGGRASIPGLGDVPAHFDTHLGHALLWESDDHPARSPAELGWPTAQASRDVGVASIRSGWGDDDLFFVLLASGRSPACTIHQHIDGGHFSLVALDEVFSIDTGYGDIAGRYHSLVMPGGREALATPADFGNINGAGGHLTEFSAGRLADHSRVDVSSQWSCRWAFREALVVRAPGTHPYVLLLDDYNIASDFAHYLWLINSEPGNAIDLDAGAVRATIRGRANRLEIAWSYPRPEDYPVQHRIELETDQIDSFPLSHRKGGDANYFLGIGGRERPEGGPRWGAGVRPRLKATLYGFNGLLLSALIPRRADQPPAATRRIATRGHFGLVIDHGEVVDTVVASPVDRRLDLAGLSGEARLAVLRRDRAGRLLWWAAVDAYALTADGAPLLERQPEPVPLAESNGSLA